MKVGVHYFATTQSKGSLIKPQNPSPRPRNADSVVIVLSLVSSGETAPHLLITRGELVCRQREFALTSYELAIAPVCPLVRHSIVCSGLVQKV